MIKTSPRLLSIRIENKCQALVNIFRKYDMTDAQIQKIFRGNFFLNNEIK